VEARNRGGAWRSRSVCDCLHQRLDPEDIEHPPYIVGEHLKAHLGFDLFQGPGQEVSASHPCLERSEGVLNGLSADGHGLWHAVDPGLHPVEHGFVLPALLPFDLVSRALGFEPAGWHAVRLR